MPAAVSLIEDNSLRATPGGFEIKVRLNWYRSLPLSCVEKITLSVDNEEIDPESITFGINDHLHKLGSLPELTGEYWFIQDPASLQVALPGKITPGTAHTIAAEITIRAPYILVGPGKFLTMPTKYAAVQVAG